MIQEATRARKTNRWFINSGLHTQKEVYYLKWLPVSIFCSFPLDQAGKALDRNLFVIKWHSGWSTSSSQKMPGELTSSQAVGFGCEQRDGSITVNNLKSAWDGALVLWDLSHQLPCYHRVWSCRRPVLCSRLVLACTENGSSAVPPVSLLLFSPKIRVRWWFQFWLGARRNLSKNQSSSRDRHLSHMVSVRVLFLYWSL